MLGPNLLIISFSSAAYMDFLQHKISPYTNDELDKHSDEHLQLHSIQKNLSAMAYGEH